MVDKWTTKWSAKLLIPLAKFFVDRKITPDFVTIFGFFLGAVAVGCISIGEFSWGLAFIALNRLFDGLDGVMARLVKPTDRGGFLDITLDFLFYSGVVLGFGLYDISANGAAALVLMFSFVATGTTFLAFSIIAERRKLKSEDYKQKGIYYLMGIAEGTETIIFFLLICIFPDHFSIFAYVFAFICYLTALLRVLMGYQKFS